MQRYFLKKENGYSLTNDDVFHILKVMRMKMFDSFEIVNNEGIFLVRIISITPFKYEIVKKVEENNELQGYLRLLYCIPKGEKLDLVIQKACELGVNEVVLINSSRCVAKIDDKNKNKKLERFNKIIKEASEQSKRSSLMILAKIIDYKDIIKFKDDLNFIAYEDESKNKKIEVLSYLEELKYKTINILIGPEGGFSKEEVAYARNNGYILTSLGKRILRSETACFSLISLLSYFMN